MSLKIVRVVYDEKIEVLLKDHLNKICYQGYESNVKYIKVVVFGITLLKMGICKIGNINNKKPVKLHYQYDLCLYGSEQDLEKDTNHAGLKAKKLIKKFVEKPEEPYKPNVQRPKDFIISDDFKANQEYTGHWIDVDMNSAEPYYVTQAVPELAQAIKQRYAMRQQYPENKMILNAINGNLRNMYVSTYEEVVNNLFEKMGWLWDELIKYGITPFALRRDGILALLPFKECPIPPSIKVSDKMGDFKVKYDHGTIRTSSSDYVYETDMKVIGSKITGTQTARYLDRLTIVCYGRFGLVIKEDN